MIEVTVHDVVARTATSGEVKYGQSAVKDGKVGPWRVILLKKSPDRAYFRSGWGQSRATSLRCSSNTSNSDRLHHISDLTTRLLSLGNTKCSETPVAELTALRGNVYFATMWVNANGELHEVDARPSDWVLRWRCWRTHRYSSLGDAHRETNRVISEET